MADDRLPSCRSPSIAATRSERVTRRLSAISLSPLQNASSRLTLVLWPAITIDRLITGDFIARLLFRSGLAESYGRCHCRIALSPKPGGAGVSRSLGLVPHGRLRA